MALWCACCRQNESCVCVQFAPGLIAGLVLCAIPLIPFVYLNSLRAFSWWFRHITSPASGQGTIYGFNVVGTEPMSKKEFDDLKSQHTQRPDLSGGGNVPEDKQVCNTSGVSHRVQRTARARNGHVLHAGGLRNAFAGCTCTVLQTSSRQFVTCGPCSIRVCCTARMHCCALPGPAVG